jgi:hypothetical protein
MGTLCELAKPRYATRRRSVEGEDVLGLAQAPGKRSPGQLRNRLLECGATPILKGRDEGDLRRFEAGSCDQLEERRAARLCDCEAAPKILGQGVVLAKD